MLNHTFCHIHGIGEAGEKKLWQQGICTWAELLAHPVAVTRVSALEIQATLEQSALALADSPHFFSTRLKRRDCWRLFREFRDVTGYLDIETTGLGPGCDITTIALYDGVSVKTYVNGRNLEEFLDDIRDIKLFVSYNGISFDIPVIEHFFRIRLDQAHIDLRYVLARLGYRGGLKGCEKQLGISRGSLDGVDGYFAVLLWREYERYHNEQALETLLAYNIEDTVNLERLMVEAYNRNVEQTPFYQNLQLDYPDLPQILHQPDPAIVEMIRRRSY